MDDGFSIGRKKLQIFDISIIQIAKVRGGVLL